MNNLKEQKIADLWIKNGIFANGKFEVEGAFYFNKPKDGILFATTNGVYGTDGMILEALDDIGVNWEGKESKNKVRITIERIS
jgi:hypothetical protein